MSEIERVLAQLAPPASSLTDVYVCGTVGAVISSLILCNRGSSVSRVRISVAVNGAADDVSQYVYYDLPIPGNDTFIATIGISLATDDVVRVFVDIDTVSVSIFGVEIT